MADETQIQHLNKIESLILSNFSPASSLAHADLMLTTDDIIQRIEEYNGILYSKETVVGLLEKNNFICIPDSQLHFVWLFLEK